MALVDLHFHSCHSDDGEFAPEALLGFAAETGLRAVALTDHNSVEGVASAIASGKKLGIDVVPAIETDCLYDGGGLHVLGYFIDHADPRWRRLQDDVVEQGRAMSGPLLDRVEDLGLVVNKDAIMAKARDGVVIVEQIAEVALADLANRDNPLLVPYRPGGSRSDNPLVNFYWDYCSQGKPAHVAVEYLSLEDVIALIRGTGGVPVLAHPGAVLKDGAKRLPDLADKGIVGVEAYSSYHSPEACEFWREAALDTGLFVTCGSDFHGKTKPAIRMGIHGAPAGDETAAIRQLAEAAGREAPEWAKT